MSSIDHRLGRGVEHDAANRLAVERVDHDAAGAELAQRVGLVLAPGQADDLVAGFDELRDRNRPIAPDAPETRTFTAFARFASPPAAERS